MALLTLSLVLLTGDPAIAADGCAAEIISARGEPAGFVWLAKTKARANWRSRVRALKSLGEPYSSWSRATNKTEDCQQTVRGTVCTFSASPCKR